MSLLRQRGYQEVNGSVRLIEYRQNILTSSYVTDKSPLISAAFVMESPINSIAESVLTIKDSIITDSPNSILLAGENRLLT
ncbi:MAG: hypothetical protein H6655_22860 [Ardenticatenaceae bacterium]|nr:hypothetical protein [Ardenticatenaceae bacterium]